MANDFQALTSVIVERTMGALRGHTVLPRLVFRDFQLAEARKGETVNVPFPVAGTVSAVAPSNVSPNAPDTEMPLETIVINQWNKSEPFDITDKEWEQIEADEGFVPPMVNQRMVDLVEKINGDLMNEAKLFFNSVGTPGTTPFASNTKVAALARAELEKQKTPRSQRFAVLDPDAEANAIDQARFVEADKTGNPLNLMEGTIGRKLGFDWFSDQQVPTHTPGVPGGTPVTNGAVTAASQAGKRFSTVVVDGLTATTGTYKRGDLITFASHTQQYSIRDDVTADAGGEVTLVVYPNIQSDVADGEAVALVTTTAHVVNVAAHPLSIGMVMRAPRTDARKAAIGESVTMQDETTGLILRLERFEQYKQQMWEWDALYGIKVVRPEWGVRIFG